MLNIGDKTFMNLQEAVGWLLENNALPFQSTANYVANTEIAMSTLVNPSPAKVRVGSLIFFADSKVSTVVGVTSNSFIVSDQYNDLVDDIVYVSNVAINASGHLICTLSNGDTIDAGLIKQVNNFSINASQHLIVSYNDGTSTDLGAIFQGNVNISGTLNATSITGGSIIETMTGYSVQISQVDMTWTPIYVGICKNGNKLSLVAFGKFNKDALTPASADVVRWIIPAEVGQKIYPYTIGANDNVLDNKNIQAQGTDSLNYLAQVTATFFKLSDTLIGLRIRNMTSISNNEYVFRAELTLLTSPNLAL